MRSSLLLSGCSSPSVSRRESNTFGAWMWVSCFGTGSWLEGSSLFRSRMALNCFDFRLLLGGLVLWNILAASVRFSSGRVRDLRLSSFGISLGVIAKCPPFASTEISSGDRVRHQNTGRHQNTDGKGKKNF